MTRLERNFIDPLRRFTTREYRKQMSHHIWTSSFLAHLQRNLVGPLKTNAAIDQQERPHKTRNHRGTHITHVPGSFSYVNTSSTKYNNWPAPIPQAEKSLTHFLREYRYGSTMSTKSLGALYPYPGMSTSVNALPTRKKFIFFV